MIVCGDNPVELDEVFPFQHLSKDRVYLPRRGQRRALPHHQVAVISGICKLFVKNAVPAGIVHATFALAALATPPRF